MLCAYSTNLYVIQLADVTLQGYFHFIVFYVIENFDYFSSSSCFKNDYLLMNDVILSFWNSNNFYIHLIYCKSNLLVILYLVIR